MVNSDGGGAAQASIKVIVDSEFAIDVRSGSSPNVTGWAPTTTSCFVSQDKRYEFRVVVWL